MKRIPNILSFSRIPLSLSLLFIAEKPALFLFAYLVTGLTDVLDGFLARRYHWESKFGAKLDGTADILFMLSMLAVIFGVLRFRPKLYVMAALGVVVLLKLANLCFTKLKFGSWSTMHTLANKYTALPFYCICPVLVWLQQSLSGTELVDRIINLLLVVFLSTVFVANLEETLILARMREYDADMKSVWHLRKQGGLVEVEGAKEDVTV